MTNCSSSTEAAKATNCCSGAVVFDGATPAYRRALAAVIGINLVGFGVVGIGSWMANSASLAANTLDFLTDASTYGLSLWAIGQSAYVRATSALLKGASLGLIAAAILGFAFWRTFAGVQPDGGVISGLGLFGAAANLLAVALLMGYREGDANVRSIWLCTRNDLIQCLAVAGTGVAVAATGSRWPDLVVGAFLAGVFLRSAWQIMVQARDELRVSKSVAAMPELITHSHRAVAEL